jgi:3-hydroxybutyrate dehydrogenase
MKKCFNQTGVIGKMASVHVHICSINKPVYNIVKFGLRDLVQSISAEGEGKTRSFCIGTGFMKTDLA